VASKEFAIMKRIYEIKRLPRERSVRLLVGYTLYSLVGEVAAVSKVTESCVYVIKTNMMHYLASVYFVTQPLHVSGIFVVSNKEVYCTGVLISP